MALFDWMLIALMFYTQYYTCPVSYTHLDVYKRQLVDGLLEELNCDVVFKIPIFGGIPIYLSLIHI